VTVTPLIQVAQATVTRDGTGLVTVDDPESPIVVRVRIDTGRTPFRISELTVQARHPSAQITPAALSRLPLIQIRHVAANQSRNPNDVLLHACVSPRPLGSRHWDAQHWREVLDVNDWAVSVGRPGGGAQAISDVWHVTKNPTAYRWLVRARHERDMALPTAPRL
jgi:hypothetical protein